MPTTHTPLTLSALFFFFFFFFFFFHPPPPPRRPRLPLGFTINFFFGQSCSDVWVNNNGNVTFGAALSDYTPSNLTTFGNPILAAFFADVDTRGAGSGVVDYGDGTRREPMCSLSTFPTSGATTRPRR